MKIALRLLLVSAAVLGLAETTTVAAQEATPGGEIIGGTRADPGEYPFQVALLQHGVANPWGAQFCGGTLISPDTVLTAGHCVVGSTPADIDILAGTNQLIAGDGRRVRARRIRLHPGYDDVNLANDIAVIQLGVNLPYPSVTPAVPGQEGLYAPGTAATTIGWGVAGSTASSGYHPHNLREVEVPVVSDPVCADAYPGELIADQMVCAGDMVDGGEDSCYGDSGGPLLVPDGPDWLQIGVVSTGRGCARRAYPGIYTEVSAFDGFVGPYLDPDSEPDAVTGLRRRSVSPNAFRISWTAPYFDGGTRITQYRVQLADLGRTHVAPGGQTYLRLRDLPPGRHLVSVQAVNAVGAGPARNIFIEV